MNWASASGSSIFRGSIASSAEPLESVPSIAAALDCIAGQRAGHAMASAAALAKLESRDRDDFDSRFSHLGDGVRVSLIRDDDARLDRDRVVGVVPLLALGLVLVAAGLDDVQLLDPERVGHR